MKYIQRKSLLYKTKVEYGDYTINHVQGCSHGCLYPCYAMLMAKRFGRVKTYEEWCEPLIVENALELLDKEIPLLKDKIKFVQLCFTTDPFMYKHNEICDLSIKIIEKLNKNNIKCTALTKGILPKSLINTSKENEFGITLVSLKEGFRREVEPGASQYIERIKSLKFLHDYGFKTWISIEPYPTPNILEQDFNELLNTISFTNKIIFGRLNYNSKSTSYKNHMLFYNELSKKVIDFCKENNILYHIKKGTLIEIDDRELRIS
ncbi:MAG: radical SAM protein [Oscillospiraceae bacterium]|nr:radical SAM protein [Oscillospiraceae bacterium]